EPQPPRYTILRRRAAASARCDVRPELPPEPPLRMRASNGEVRWKGGIPDLPGLCVVAILEKRSLTARSHDPQHCACLSATAGSLSGRGLSSSMRGLPLLGAEITAWT